MNENQLADKIFAALMNEGLIVFEPGSAPRSLIVIREVLEKNPVPRHNQRGLGAHYAGKITELSPTHQDVLDALDAKGAHSYETGLPLQELTMTVNYLRTHSGRANIKDSTVTGRCSELQGLGAVSCVPSEVDLVERETMRFESKQESRWYRTQNMILLEAAQLP